MTNCTLVQSPPGVLRLDWRELLFGEAKGYQIIVTLSDGCSLRKSRKICREFPNRNSQSARATSLRSDVAVLQTEAELWTVHPGRGRRKVGLATLGAQKAKSIG